LESRKLPTGINYLSLAALSKEAREKLNKLRPTTFGQAGRISGISPADITALLVYLRKGTLLVSRETAEMDSE
jgi:tRNA uridine 5-carboxymethylaminomethyl modification enzyme